MEFNNTEDDNDEEDEEDDDDDFEAFFDFDDDDDDVVDVDVGRSKKVCMAKSGNRVTISSNTFEATRLFLRLTN